MKVLIIGGTRFIGPAVVRRLHARGCELLIFHRGQHEAADLPDVPHVHGDRHDLPDYLPEFRAFNPEVVLDMDLRTAQEAWSVMRSFRGVAKRIVAPSSIDVYRAHGRVNGREPGPVDPLPFTEDEGPFRNCLYPYRDLAADMEDEERRLRTVDYDKLLVEHLLLGDPRLPGTVLRLPMVYGPGDFQHRLFPYLRPMRDGRPVIVLSDLMASWRASRGFVENVAEAIALATTDRRAAGRVYNVADAPLEEADWLRAIAKAMDWRGKLVVAPNEALPEPLRVGEGFRQHWVVDTSRLRDELGYEAIVDLEEALRRTVAWELEHPPEQPIPCDYEAEDAFLAATTLAE